MHHTFLPDIAIADIAFKAKGKTLEELMENCGYALTEAMSQLGKIKEKTKKKITVTGKDADELLYNFLSELVYVKDVEGLLFKKFRAKLSRNRLDVECHGDTLECIGRENLNNDVKAITMYKFGIRKEGKRFTATVVVDI